MKKIFCLILAVMTSVLLCACGEINEKPIDTGNGNSDSIDSAPLKDIMIYVVKSAGMETEGDWDYFYQFTSPQDAANIIGAPSLDCSFKEGISYTGVFGAFDFAMFKTENHEKAVELAKLLKKNANPGKYVCMRAESVKTAVRGDVVMFIMSSAKTTENYVGYFNAFGND